DNGLWTMFGTSCPFEVRFPAAEVASAFAQISAARLLPLLASYQPTTVSVTEADKTEWRREWRNVVRFDAISADPNAVKLADFRPGEFEDASEADLDTLWQKRERFESEADRRIREVLALKRKEEERRINEIPLPGPNGSGAGISLLHRHIQ